jgi:hypothetical protein
MRLEAVEEKLRQLDAEAAHACAIARQLGGSVTH